MKRTLERVSVGVGEKFVYRVEYLDHLFEQRKVSVLGDAVFLCAGAVNSTELPENVTSVELPSVTTTSGNIIVIS